MESSKKAKIESFAHFNKKGAWKHLFLGLVINLEKSYMVWSETTWEDDLENLVWLRSVTRETKSVLMEIFPDITIWRYLSSSVSQTQKGWSYLHLFNQIS